MGLAAFPLYALLRVSALPLSGAPVLATATYDTFDNSGGDSITLTGSDLAGAISVDVGGTAATITGNTSTSITFTTPSTSAGSKNVTVTTAAGTSNAVSIEAYDLDGNAFSMWYRPPYGGSPWTPSTSAGGSGGAGNLTGGATAPSVGSAINGYAPADFDGTDDTLIHASNWSSFVTTTTGTVIAYALVDTVAANQTVANNNEAILAMASSGTGFGMCVSDAGLRAYCNDGALKSPTAVAFSTGVLNLFTARWSGGSFKQAVNNGTEQTVAIGTISSLAATVRVGRSTDGARFLDGKVLEFMALSSELTQAEIGKIYTCLRCRYAQ